MLGDPVPDDLGGEDLVLEKIVLFVWGGEGDVVVEDGFEVEQPEIDFLEGTEVLGELHVGGGEQHGEIGVEDFDCFVAVALENKFDVFLDHGEVLVNREFQGITIIILQQILKHNPNLFEYQTIRFDLLLFRQIQPFPRVTDSNQNIQDLFVYIYRHIRV